MNRSSTIVTRALLAAMLSQANSVYATSVGTMHATVMEPSTAMAKLYLRYAKGLIDIRIENVPLEKVMRELMRYTGIQVSLTDRDIAQWPISASLQAIPLEQGIKALLDGFSYVLYRINGTPAVLVLSSHPNPTKMGLKGAMIGLKPAEPTTNDLAIANQGPDLEMPKESSNEEVPQSLDEFQPITVEEPGSYSEEGDQDQEAPARLTREQEYNEALLRRALDAIKSEHKLLHIEAIDQLASLQDPQATQALVDAVSSNASLDKHARLQAVAAIWRHARDRTFADAVSVNALTQLTEDSDENIRSLARQALQDMEHYQNSARPGE